MTELNNTHIEEFRELGYTVVRGFFDLESEITPILSAIHEILALTLDKHSVDAPCATPQEAMSQGYRALIVENRAWGSEVYDAVKNIPAFIRLISGTGSERAFAALREGSRPGLAHGGFGVRIDNPLESRYRAPWHQEFPAQLRSLDGVVFWSPLLQVTRDMGPVEIAERSHGAGLIPVSEDTSGGQGGAYGLRLDKEHERLAPYAVAAPLTEPGDLILMDFLTVHRSGENQSDRPRWSMQYRYFNFKDPLGVKIGWSGSYAAGKRFDTIMPELKAVSS